MVSGDLTDLASDNNVYTTFRSYDSGNHTTASVTDNTSDVDSSADKGTHSNFTAQQYGPDLIGDTLTEENTGGSGGNSTLWLYVNADDENKTDWTRVGTDPYLDAIDYNANYTYVSGKDMLVGDFGFADSGKSMETIDSVEVQLYAKQSDSGLKFTVFVWDGTGWTASSKTTVLTSWSWVNWTATAVLDTWTKVDGAKVYIATDSSVGTFEVDCIRLKVDYSELEANHQLDLELQWTNVDFDQFNEELCICRGLMGAENIMVDVWNGSDWENVFTDLNSGWNNISVSSYLDSSTFTIRFKGSMESGDTVQDSWNIDVTLLHVWSNEYTTEVEFTGSSDLANWSKINWTTSMGWTISSVTVTLQLYNYSLGDYSGGGDGYVSYISNATAQEDQTVSRIVADNPNHFRNSTGHWMMEIKGVKAAETQFDLKVDWIELKLSSEYGPVVDWGEILVYALPVVFGLLFTPILIYKRKKRTDPSVEDEVHPFSRSFGMTHQQMAGEKMLLEIDPTVDFQKTLFNFATEAKNSDEKLYIFTSRGSPLHLKFSRAKDTEFHLLVSKAHSAQQKNPKETLLPANDLSVLLNTITRIQGAKTRKPLNILFDNLSDTILLCGFEKTYKFIRWLLEATPSPKRTILFVFNPAAHDLKTSSSIRGLFQTRLAHGKNGPRLGTL